MAFYVVVQAGWSLWERSTAGTSIIGFVVAVVAAVGMPILARCELQVAERIGSGALRADAIETITCRYFAWVLLGGLLFNAIFRWWWIDSVAVLLIAPLLLREAQEAFSGRCCTD